MIKLKFKFWNLDNSEEDIEKEVLFAPERGDKILFKNKWYDIDSRGIDFDNDVYTKIYCREIPR